MDPYAQPGGPSAATMQTQASLEAEEKEDSGLGLEWIYLNAEAGGSYIGLDTISSSDLRVHDSSSGGAMFGLGAGVRLLFLTLGVRVRDHVHSSFNLWQFNGEIGAHGRFGRIDPYLLFRGGYSTTASLNEVVEATSNDRFATDISVHGLNLGLALGLDYYFSHLLSVGAEASGDFLLLTRPKADLPAPSASLSPADRDRLANDPLYKGSGSSAGIAAGLSAHVGFHF
jgi:hypothetical protein